MKKNIFISGISGQDGTLLAEFLSDKNYNIIGLTRNSAQLIENKNNYTIEEVDLLSINSITEVFSKYKPIEFFNFSSQSSVSESFKNPFETLTYNYLSVLNILECIRINNYNTKFLQASSSEIYGNSLELPINENHIPNPNNPYSISKASAYNIVNLYREVYNLFCSNAILFNHESFLRKENFFIKKLVTSAIKLQKKEIEYIEFGNLNISRDFGDAEEYCEIMWKILQLNNPDNFIISTGKSIKLIEIVKYVFKKLSLDINKIIIDPKLYKKNEIIEIYGDNTKIQTKLNIKINSNFYQTIDRIIDKELNLKN